jgi:hypothetical protein
MPVQLSFRLVKSYGWVVTEFAVFRERRLRAPPVMYECRHRSCPVFLHGCSPSPVLLWNGFPYGTSSAELSAL